MKLQHGEARATKFLPIRDHLMKHGSCSVKQLVEQFPEIGLYNIRYHLSFGLKRGWFIRIGNPRANGANACKYDLSKSQRDYFEAKESVNGIC